MIKIKYQPVEHYEEVEAIGVTTSVAGTEVNGSISRKPFTGRRILTETVGFDPGAPAGSTELVAATVAKGDGDRLFQTVIKVAEMPVIVSLADGTKAPPLTLRNVYVCDDTKDNVDCRIVFVKTTCNSENKEDVELFNANTITIRKIVQFAPKLVEMHPESFGEWKLVDKGEKRVFVYFYGDVDEHGYVSDK